MVFLPRVATNTRTILLILPKRSKVPIQYTWRERRNTSSNDVITEQASKFEPKTSDTGVGILYQYTIVLPSFPRVINQLENINPKSCAEEVCMCVCCGACVWVCKTCETGIIIWIHNFQVGTQRKRNFKTTPQIPISPMS